jgi:hypothetical protein
MLATTAAKLLIIYLAVDAFGVPDLLCRWKS